MVLTNTQASKHGGTVKRHKLSKKKLSAFLCASANQWHRIISVTVGSLGNDESGSYISYQCNTTHPPMYGSHVKFYKTGFWNVPIQKFVAFMYGNWKFHLMMPVCHLWGQCSRRFLRWISKQLQWKYDIPGDSWGHIIHFTLGAGNRAVNWDDFWQENSFLDEVQVMEDDNTRFAKILMNMRNFSPSLPFLISLIPSTTWLSHVVELLQMFDEQ